MGLVWSGLVWYVLVWFGSGCIAWYLDRTGWNNEWMNLGGYCFDLKTVCVLHLLEFCISFFPCMEVGVKGKKMERERIFGGIDNGSGEVRWDGG